ncbi:CDIF630_02480 family spore surface protein [Anaerovorax odorimutans]|uniref:CDIF630_02480 family spore surface protein n=1 Tax=Anaerovorax odorimutans TaxID=109327 RepID=UPI00040318E6|nr:DUF3787 domain-containing protein [Anaerovorax odorimutans]
MKNKIVNNFDEKVPNFTTFPLEEIDYNEGEANLPIAFEDSIIEAKEWVDFKEM